MTHSTKSAIFHLLAAAVITAAFTACGGPKPLPDDVNVESAADADTTSDVADSPAKDALEKQSVSDSVKVQSGTESIVTEPSTYIPTGGNVVPGSLIALTFDDGPNTTITPRVLDILKKYGAHATFFCVGNCIGPKTIPVMQRAVAEGNEIASHTYSHPSLAKATREKRQTEMRRTSEAIKNAVGYYPNFYRPPYLDINKSALADIDLPGITGSASDDWMTSHTPEMIVATVLKTARPGAIYVMHDFAANSRTPEALETLIPRLQELGYTLVTVSDIFASMGVVPQAHCLYSSPTHLTMKATMASSVAAPASAKAKTDSAPTHTKPDSSSSATPAETPESAPADTTSTL